MQGAKKITGPEQAHQRGRLAAHRLPPDVVEAADTLVDQTDSAELLIETDGIKELGGYVLKSKIGHGGMGVVYRAISPDTGKEVALKVIASHRLTDEDQRRRFVLEAETAAQLKHPNIVSVHKAGQDHGFHYMVMDYVKSITLSNLLDGQPFAPDTAVKVVLSLAQTLDYVHREGILHRDIKPSNVLVDQAGQPWLTDFGVAKRMLEDDWVTATGMVLGTPSYMPPEQIAGKHELMGPASDIYSLGALLYEMLTGRPPFRSKTAFDTLQLALYTTPTPPRRHNRSVPATLETICLQCLEKSPFQRYANARDLVADLNAYLANKPIAAKRQRRGWSQTNDNWDPKLNIRDPDVLAQWARVWKWIGVLMFVLFLGSYFAELADLHWQYTTATLWGGGICIMAAIVWAHRFHHAKPFTPLEWQVARLWLLFGFGAVGLAAIGYQMNWSWSQAMPFFLLMGAMAFGCMTLFIDRTFALLTLLCMTFAILALTTQQAPALVYGAGFAIGLYLPARKYSQP